MGASRRCPAVALDLEHAVIIAALALLAAAAWRASSYQTKTTTTIVALASKAGPKLRALETALARLSDSSSDTSYCVEPCKAPSGIAEQPHGVEETKLGAKNRLAATKRLRAGERCDFIVAIENGIVQHGDDDEGGGCWYDFAWVLVEECASQRVAAVMSTALQFQQQYIDQALDAPGVRT